MSCEKEKLKESEKKNINQRDQTKTQEKSQIDLNSG